MDLEARDPYELLEEIENVLGIKHDPINWPIGSGKDLKACMTEILRRFQCLRQFQLVVQKCCGNNI